MVDTHAAYTAAPETGLLWVALRAGAPPAPALPARCAGGASSHNPVSGLIRGASPSLPTSQQLLSGAVGASKRELSRPAHAARRARLFAALSGWARAGLAAVQGGRAALWLSAAPAAGGGRGSIRGPAMRVAVRLLLGAPAHSDPPWPRCACGAAADAGGPHFLGACRAQLARRTALHHDIVALVAVALRRAPSWGGVAVERLLDGSDGALRLDFRATAAATGAVTWCDVSVASP